MFAGGGGGSLSANDAAICLGATILASACGDPDWDSLVFQWRYADVFSSNYIAELFCQSLADNVDPLLLNCHPPSRRLLFPMC